MDGALLGTPNWSRPDHSSDDFVPNEQSRFEGPNAFVVARCDEWLMWFCRTGADLLANR